MLTRHLWWRPQKIFGYAKVPGQLESFGLPQAARHAPFDILLYIRGVTAQQTRNGGISLTTFADQCRYALTDGVIVHTARPLFLPSTFLV